MKQVLKNIESCDKKQKTQITVFHFNKNDCLQKFLFNETVKEGRFYSKDTIQPLPDSGQFSGNIVYLSESKKRKRIVINQSSKGVDYYEKEN